MVLLTLFIGTVVTVALVGVFEYSLIKAITCKNKKRKSFAIVAGIIGFILLGLYIISLFI